MTSLKRILTYIRRHLDFLLLDLLTFSLAYFATVQIRRAMDIRIHHGELFLKYGIVVIAIYVIVEIRSQNLNGIVSRSIPREAAAVGFQMLMTWSIYTVILYLLKEAHDFSRMIYVSAFFVCSLAILIVRTIWKAIVKYGRIHDRVSPKLLIVCEASRAQEILTRMLHGNFENRYDICGVVMNDKEPVNYNDWYPHATGLSQIPEFIIDKHVQDAYIELDDANEEADAISMLLNAGVIVHRSLGDSRFEYVNQRINDLGGRSVITIEDTQISLISKADQLWDRIRKRKARK